MTTKILDNESCTFKIVLSWRFSRKTAFGGNFSSLPPRPTPLKGAMFIYIVVSQSLTLSLLIGDTFEKMLLKP